MHGTQINHLLLQGPQAPLLANILVARTSPAELEVRGQLIIMLEMPGKGSKAQVIINEFLKELVAAYYNSPTDNIDGCLEYVLRLANNHLPTLATNFDKRWIDKTSMLLMVHDDNFLYFASIGAIKGLLITPQKTTNITETNITNINPLKPFNFVSSGQLPKESAICFTTNTLFDYISQEKLRKLCLQLPPLGVIQNLEDLLVNKSPRLNILALFLRHMFIVDHLTIDKESGSLITNDVLTVPTSEQSIKNLAKQRSQTAKFLSVPSLKQTFWLRLKDFIKTVTQTKQRLVNQQTWQTWQSNLRRYWLISRTTVSGLSQRGKKLSNYFWPPNYWLSGLALIINPAIKKIKLLNKRSKIILIVVILIIIILCQGLLNRQNLLIPNSTSLPPNFINSSQQLLVDAGNALIYGDEQKAKELLTAWQKLLNPLTAKQKNDPALQPLLNNFNDLNNKLSRRININELKTTATLLGQNPKELTIINNDIWTITNNGLIKINTSNNTVTTVNNLTGNLLTGDNSGLYLINDEKIYFINDNQATALNWIKANNQQQSSKIKTYNGRLYVLDNNAKQIFRYRRQNNELSNGSNWLKQPLATVGQDLALDGSLYLLSSQTVQKFNQGSVANFSMDTVWPELQQPANLALGNQYIYILEPINNRLVIINKKTGQLDRQYYSPLLQNAKAMAVDQNERHAYVLIGEEIKNIDLATR